MFIRDFQINRAGYRTVELMHYSLRFVQLRSHHRQFLFRINSVYFKDDIRGLGHRTGDGESGKQKRKQKQQAAGHGSWFQAFYAGNTDRLRLIIHSHLQPDLWIPVLLRNASPGSGFVILPGF